MLEALGEPPIAIGPREGAFEDPSARQDLEAARGIGSLDDCDGPFADPAQGFLEFVPGMTAVSEYVPQPGKTVQVFGEYQRRAVSILNVGGVDHCMSQIALGVGEDAPLMAFDLLDGIVAPIGLRPLIPALEQPLDNLKHGVPDVVSGPAALIARAGGSGRPHAQRFD